MLNRHRLRRQLVTALKYAIGVGILGWVLGTVDLGEILYALGQFSSTTIGIVIVISILNILAHAATWLPFTGDTDTWRYDRLISADLVIKFVNSLFPSRLSGRLIAPAALHHFIDLSWSESVAASIAHTGLYAILYGLFTLISLLSVNVYGIGLTLLIFVSTAAYLAVGCLVIIAGLRLGLFERWVSRIGGFFDHLPGGGLISSALESFRETLLDGSQLEFQQFIQSRRIVIFYGLSWILAVLVLPASRLWILLSASNVTGVDPLMLPFYLIAAYSVTILPLTPSGIGIAEATAVAVFVALGMPEATIVTVVLLDRVFGVYLPSLAGWLPLVRSNLGSLIE